MIGRAGTHELDSGRVEGEDPLAPFGPNAARHVARTDGFPHCADIMVNSTYWDGQRTRWPRSRSSWARTAGWAARSRSRSCSIRLDLEPPEAELIGAEAVHRELRRWLVQLGHESYREVELEVAEAEA